MPVRLGDRVRFRSCNALETMRGRKRRLGALTLEAETGPEPWPVVQFESYRSAALQPEILEVVDHFPARDDPEMAN